VCTQVHPAYWELKELTLFLTAPGALDPSLALVRALTRVRGAITIRLPSNTHLLLLLLLQLLP